MIYAINYDLKGPGQNYAKLHEAIKSCGEWWHYLDSTWLVATSLTASGVWQKIKPYADKSDFILVIGVTRDFQGWLPQDAWDWINARSGKMAA